MALEALPQELQLAIVDMLEPRDVKRFMQTCRAARDLGKRADVWRALRELHGMPPPKPRARVYKTDHDIVARKLCRICWQGWATPSMHNLCRACTFHNDVLRDIAVTITHRRWRLRIDEKRLARVQDVIRTHEEILAECRVWIVAEAARLQAL